jgi:hypothetical protein
MSSSEPKAKRAKPEPEPAKISHPDASRIACRLGELSKVALEDVARVGITESSEAALKLAKFLLSAKDSRMLHCVRCHENYDPSTNSNGCVMDDHDEGEGMIRCNRGGWDAFKYSCCKKYEDDSSPCFVGPHIEKYGDGGRYWDDDSLEETNKEGDCPVCNGDDDKDDEDDDDEEEEEGEGEGEA